jgi:hypothetical protein
MIALFIGGMLAGSGSCALASWAWLRGRRKRRERDQWLVQQFVNGKLDALRVPRGPHPAGQGVS